MKIKWYGHAGFRVTSDESGLAIITDPYNPEISGYDPITETPDIAIMSSDNDPWHSRADLIPGDFPVINALDIVRSGGSHVEKGITFRAVESMEAHDHPSGHPDQNAMYRFEVDGISIGHMGDMGNAFSQAQIEFFTNIDILLTLAGGYPTTRLNDLNIALEAIQPRLIIPMHFRTLTCKLKSILWIPSFLEYYDDDNVDFAYHYEVSMMPEDLPDRTRILVLDYVRV